MKEYISRIMKQFLGFQFSNLVQFQNLALTQKVVLHLGGKRLRATLDEMQEFCRSFDFI